MNYTINTLHIENRLALIFTSKIDEKYQIHGISFFLKRYVKKAPFFFKNWSKNRKLHIDLCGEVKNRACFFAHTFFYKNHGFFKNIHRYISICVDANFNFQFQNCYFLTIFLFKNVKNHEKCTIFWQKSWFSKGNIKNEKTVFIIFYVSIKPVYFMLLF